MARPDDAVGIVYSLEISGKLKWAGSQKAVTFLGYRPIRS